MVQNNCNTSVELEKIYCSLLVQSSGVYISYFDEVDYTIYYTQKFTKEFNMKILENAIHHINPDVLIVNNSHFQLIPTIIIEKYDPIILKSEYYGYEICKARMLKMKLSNDEVPMLDGYEAQIKINSIIDLTNIYFVKSIGSLLRYLDENNICTYDNENNSLCKVLDIKEYVPQDLLNIQHLDIHKLNILPKGRINLRDNLSVNSVSNSLSKSLYSLEFLILHMYNLAVLNQCFSFNGQCLLRKWLSHPLKNLEKIKKRLHNVQFFLTFEMISFVIKNIKKISNINPLFMKMLCGKLENIEWVRIFTTLSCCTNIIEILENCDIHFENDLLLPQMKNSSTKLSMYIQKIIQLDNKNDNNMCNTQNNFLVNFGVDRDLDKHKELYKDLPNFLYRVANFELKRLKNYADEATIVYIPQMGYILAIKQKSATDNEKLNRCEDLDLMFMFDGIMHFRTKSTKKLDEILGDTICQIQEIEIKIINKLQNTILNDIEIVLKTLHFIAEIDCCISFSICAKKYNYVMPLFNNENKMKILQGRCDDIAYARSNIKSFRHPIEEFNNTFVCNDTTFNENSDRVYVITGPNSSGKSIYMRQIYLINYMAHIGSFVPAKYANLSLLDGIFTRIQSMESASSNMSAFMNDLSQVSNALNNSTKHSLILIDEFGQGTSAIDGMALLSACIENWTSMKNQSPFILISTHLYQILQRKILNKTNFINFCKMETCLDENDDIVYLYKCVNGICTESKCSNVMKTLNFDISIIKTAELIYETLKNGKTPSEILLNEKHLEYVQKFEEIIKTALKDREIRIDTLSDLLKEIENSLNWSD
ncbi:hypothetical protein A3Q56_03098 [Intoshia linei]|uniref:DNA mismatch repair proteins mutS family domain-containing protein n=1 Tax=Intoshia linei TaxID=1819745 RepID=A0A177B4F0_9BILA|nr:hypothetical protein A3Q56_03098 [Intoshia linei]